MSDNKIIEFFREYGDGKTKIFRSDWKDGIWVTVDEDQITSVICEGKFWGVNQDSRTELNDVVPECAVWKIYKGKPNDDSLKLIDATIDILNVSLTQLLNLRKRYVENNS